MEVMSIKCLAVELDGVLTDIVLGNYENLTLVIATQNQKPGPFIRVQKENFTTFGEPQNVYSIQTLFGNDKEKDHVVVRILVEKLEAAKLSKPILFSVYLQNDSVATLQGLAKVLLDSCTNW